MARDRSGGGRHADTLNADGLAGVAARFDEEHRRLFTFNMDSPHELVNLRAVALGPVLDLPAQDLAATGATGPVTTAIRQQ